MMAHGVLIAAMALAAVSFGRAAAAAGPAVDGRWPLLLNRIRHEGAPHPRNPPWMESRRFQKVSAPETESRTANYINLWGGRDEDGEFIPVYSTMNSEVWTLDAVGNWTIDQWLFTKRLDGSTSEVFHRSWNTDPRGIQTVPDVYHILPRTDQSPEDQAKIDAKENELVDFWLSFVPEGVPAD
ncbi:MAG: hypothetical protein HY078_10210 [Elusimicrobia bacterium]|nr:hypothetical protein [Elusimicrobiota bacterium]